MRRWRRSESDARTTSEHHERKRISPLGGLRRSFVAGDGQVRLVDVVHNACASKHRRERDSVHAKRKHASRLVVWSTGHAEFEKHARASEVATLTVHS